MLAKLGVLVAVRVLFLVLQPQLGECQVELTIGATAGRRCTHSPEAGVSPNSVHARWGIDALRDGFE